MVSADRLLVICQLDVSFTLHKRSNCFDKYSVQVGRERGWVSRKYHNKDILYAVFEYGIFKPQSKFFQNNSVTFISVSIFCV